MKEYIDKKVAIVVANEEESIKINEMIVAHGGRNLHSSYSRKPQHYYGLEQVSRGQNCHTDSDWYVKRTPEYTIIPASAILLGQNYQIF